MFTDSNSRELKISEFFGGTAQTLTTLSHFHKLLFLKFTFLNTVSLFSELVSSFLKFCTFQDCEIEQLHDKMFQNWPRWTDYSSLLYSNDLSKCKFWTGIQTIQEPVSRSQTSLQAERKETYEVTI